jgi:hypothetical protein
LHFWPKNFIFMRILQHKGATLPAVMANFVFSPVRVSSF